VSSVGIMAQPKPNDIARAAVHVLAGSLAELASYNQLIQRST
jgi:hypothetical protein